MTMRKSTQELLGGENVVYQAGYRVSYVFESAFRFALYFSVFAILVTAIVKWFVGPNPEMFRLIYSVMGFFYLCVFVYSTGRLLFRGVIVTGSGVIFNTWKAGANKIMLNEIHDVIFISRMFVKSGEVTLTDKREEVIAVLSVTGDIDNLVSVLDYARKNYQRESETPSLLEQDFFS